MLTVKFFKPFPDWSDPKRVCTCQVWVLSNPLCKSHVWLCTSHWWWDLSDTLTFVKMLIFEVWISMKSSFDQVSIIRPTTVSFSSIFFMFDLGERSLHVCFISNLFIHYHLFKGDFYSSKGWLVWNHHIFTHCFCSIRSLCAHEKISQVIKKTWLHIIYRCSVQGFY